MKFRLSNLLYIAFLFVACSFAWSQQAPLPANAEGKWTLYCNDPNGITSAKYLDLKQTSTNITGHFKGTYQSGSVTGTIDEQHLVVRTNTRNPLVFRGRIDGPRLKTVRSTPSIRSNPLNVATQRYPSGV
jgi:hypothetical protein